MTGEHRLRTSGICLGQVSVVLCPKLVGKTRVRL